jgi:hypothetical protein
MKVSFYHRCANPFYKVIPSTCEKYEHKAISKLMFVYSFRVLTQKGSDLMHDEYHTIIQC